MLETDEPALGRWIRLETVGGVGGSSQANPSLGWGELGRTWWWKALRVLEVWWSWSETKRKAFWCWESKLSLLSGGERRDMECQEPEWPGSWRLTRLRRVDGGRPTA